MQTTNGKRQMQMTPQQQQQMTPMQQQLPSVQQPAIPLPAMLMAQLPAIVGPMNDAEILQAMQQLSPAGYAGELSIETTLRYYEED